LKSKRIEFQFYLDGSLKAAWGKEANYAWKPVRGKHKLKVEIKDSKGQDSKEVEYYVYRRPLSPQG
jgi:hypothetical protein